MKARSILLALIAITMTACFTPNPPEVVFNEADLLGLWGKHNGSNQDTIPTEFIRFTSEQDETAEYKYGREWNEAEDVFENDLKPYGNGWFKYKLVLNDLTEIHLMDNGGADIPKVYQIIKLDAYDLQYKDQQGKTYYWSKVGLK